MSAATASERLTAVLRAAQYLSNLSPKQDPWAEWAQALKSFFKYDLLLVVRPDQDGELRLVHAFTGGIPAVEIFSLAREEVRSVLASGFLGSLTLAAPACSLVLIPLPRDRKTGAVAIVGHGGREPFSKEDLEILLALGGLFGNVVARVENEAELRDHQQMLEGRVAQRTAELEKTNARLVRESAERRQAEAALEQAHAELEQIFSTAGDGLRVIDRHGTVVKANAVHALRIGRPLSGIVGLSCRALSPSGDCATDACPLRRISAGSTRVESEMLRDYPMGPRQEIVVSTPFHARDGSLLGIVQVFHDITERKQVEQSLRASEAALREADRHKDEFLAVLSHELRNPLAAIANSMQLLDQGTDRAQARDAQAVIGRQVRQLSRLVDDLLDVTRVSRNKIQLQSQPLDLVHLARRAVEDHRHAIESLGVRLEFIPRGSVWVLADAARVTQMLGNLLINAGKFTDRGGSVTLGIAVQGSRAEVTVADTGIGMDAAMLGRLFEPFMQADRSLDRSHGGLGLGLALTRGLAELHGGSVTASSPGLGRGSRFVLTLPAVPRPELRAEAPARAIRVRPHRVLIIEDNLDAALTLKMLLEFSGHEVFAAHTGGDGIAKAKAHGPEVILCDIGLPDMDGYTVARTLRGDPEARSFVLVAMTGYGQDEDKQLAFAAGFNHHLTKPADPEELQRLLAF